MKTTNIPNKMWAEHVKSRDIPTMLPRAPDSISTEVDWDGFTTKLHGTKETVRLWIESWHDFDTDNEHSCSCGDLLVGADEALSHSVLLPSIGLYLESIAS
jgi:hypothetical protein